MKPPISKEIKCQEAVKMHKTKYHNAWRGGSSDRLLSADALMAEMEKRKSFAYLLHDCAMKLSAALMGFVKNPGHNVI